MFFLDTWKSPFQSDSGTLLLLKFSPFFETWIMWREVSVILYTTDLLTISSVWSFAVPPIKYVLNYKECNSSSVFYVSVFSTLFLLLFNILFSVFFYLCIWSFVNSIWLFLNLLHESTCGTMSSRKVCGTEYKKEDWMK